jgi:hypothetical protein
MGDWKKPNNISTKGGRLEYGNKSIRVFYRVCDGGRFRESSGKVTVTMLIGLALIESLCIYALVVALILIFAHPQAASIAALFAR